MYMRGANLYAAIAASVVLLLLILIPVGAFAQSGT